MNPKPTAKVLWKYNRSRQKNLTPATTTAPDTGHLSKALWFQVVAVLTAVVGSALLGRVVGGQLCFRDTHIIHPVTLSSPLADLDADLDYSPQASPGPLALVANR